ncbi:hypothetical protein JCM8202_001279 [Rhodotorula sphaerocarpa]
MRLSRCLPPATRPPDPLAALVAVASSSNPPNRARTKPQPSLEPRNSSRTIELPPAVERARQAAAVRVHAPRTLPPRPLAEPVPSTSKATLDQCDDCDDHSRGEAQLERLLDALPSGAGQPRVAHRPTRDVQANVATWRRACAAAYTAIATLKQHKDKGKGRRLSDTDRTAHDRVDSPLPLSPGLEQKVVRLVGETMRLLLHLGHVQAAMDLDRAFFSLRKPTRSERRRRRRPHARDDDDGPSPPVVKGGGARNDEERSGVAVLGDGLGLQRDAHASAWMQAVVVRLRQGSGGGGATGEEGRGTRKGFSPTESFRALRDVEGLLGAMRKGTTARRRLGRQTAGPEAPGPPPGSPSSPPRSDLLAFTARQMGRVQRLARTTAALRPSLPPSPSPPAPGGELQAWLEEIRRSECRGDDEMVSLALLESGLERLEGAGRDEARGGVRFRRRNESALLDKVEEDLHRLVRSLDDAVEGGQVSPARTRRRAHILALAIRFLLFRHRSSPASLPARTGPAPAPGAGAADPLLSAAKLYAVLLKTPLPRSSPPALVADLRTRQTSSLFRLLDAHLSESEHAAHACAQASGFRDAEGMGRGPYAAAAGEAVLRPVECVLELLSLTLERVGVYRSVVVGGSGDLELSRQARLQLGVSTRTYQRMLRVLAEPWRGPYTTAPSAAAGPGAGAGFSLLERALEVIARCRAHDTALAPPSSEASRGPEGQVGTGAGAGSAVFAHPKTAMHFVRAWFAAPASPPTGEGPERERARPAGGGSSSEVAARLLRLLAAVDAIDSRRRPGSVGAVEGLAAGASSSSPPVHGVIAAASLRARQVVARAVREIVEQRWGVVEVGVGVGDVLDHRRRRRSESSSSDPAVAGAVDHGGEAGGGGGMGGGGWVEEVVERRLRAWVAGETEPGQGGRVGR